MFDWLADFAKRRSERLHRLSVRWKKISLWLRGVSEAEVTAELAADEDAGKRR